MYFLQNKIIDYTYLQQILSFNNVITQIKFVNKIKNQNIMYTMILIKIYQY